MSRAQIKLPEGSRYVQSDYIEGNTGKTDLLRRLRNLIKTLKKDEVVAESEEWPGLASLAETLVNSYLDHGDKEVRLHTVIACIEILIIYAPEVPWDEDGLLLVFQHMTRQLGNLAHATNPKHPSYHHYEGMLENIAEVHIGCILVDMAQHENEKAQEMLVEFIHTLLHCVRHEHSRNIVDMVQQCISHSLEEYHPTQGVPLPIPILDELLKCVGQGPTMMILAPQAGPKRSKKSKKLPQIEVPNPSFIVAAGVIRKLLNKMAAPISQLLNGLLQRESLYLDRSSIQCITEVSEDAKAGENEVYEIIFQLHNVAPQILTTVMGAVTNDLHAPHAKQRYEVTKLLGRLFAEKKSAEEYSVCFREWLRRKQDVEVEIRVCMVRQCMAIIKMGGEESIQMVSDALQDLVTDMTLEVRSEAVRLISHWAFETPPSTITTTLLRVVADRVRSKNKQERQDALVGLAYVYNKQYLVPLLKGIVDGGDDCDLQEILNVLHDQLTNDHEADSCTYTWIPSTIFECGFFTDRIDSGMRNKVYQIVDEVLFKGLTPTAKGVAWVMLSQLVPESSMSFFHQMMRERASLQKALQSYLAARAKSLEFERGTEERIEASSRAYSLLEHVASLTAPVSGSKSSRENVLKPIHAAKDKRFFRILATITNPEDSANARKRAHSKLPDLTKHISPAAAEWTTQLVNRCSMGDSLNSEVVQSSIMLAQECFDEEDISMCKHFLGFVNLAVGFFPELGYPSEAIEGLTDLFSKCRSASGSLKKKLNDSGVVTMLSTILSSSAATSSFVDSGLSEAGKDGLESDLLQLSTEEGTPEQARNAVFTLFKMADGDETKGSRDKISGSLIRSLTSTTKLSIGEEDEDSLRLIRVFASLAALTECSPQTLSSSNGQKAVAFALEMVLLGRNSSESASDESDDSEDEEKLTKSSRQRRTKTPSKRQARSPSQGRRHATPVSKGSPLEDPNLGVVCRRICSTIEFLVSFVRFANIARKRPQANKKRSSIIAPDDDMVETLFSTLGQIITDQGLAPSTRDRKACRTRSDRAALRHFAGVSLLRLCDPRLGYEKTLLTQALWHTLGETFLDEEKVVRIGVMSELADLLSGSGSYGLAKSSLQPQPPSLRLLAYVVFCTDGDKDLDAGNGSSANVGDPIEHLRQNARKSVTIMRKLCDDFYTKCRAKGPEAEEKFDKVYKMQIMPEYMIPYAYHLLAMRRETPTSLDESSDEEEAAGNYGNSHLRHLKKRLKVAFDLLILSLGDSADNISFLVRITEVLGNKYSPVDVSPVFARQAIASGKSQGRRASELQSKLKNVCDCARESLQSYIKQDVNLAPYVNGLQIPSTIFRPQSLGTIVVPSIVPVQARKTKLQDSEQKFLASAVAPQDSDDEDDSKPAASPRKSPSSTEDNGLLLSEDDDDLVSTHSQGEDESLEVESAAVPVLDPAAGEKRSIRRSPRRSPGKKVSLPLPDEQSNDSSNNSLSGDSPAKSTRKRRSPGKAGATDDEDEDGNSSLPAVAASRSRKTKRSRSTVRKAADASDAELSLGEEASKPRTKEGRRQQQRKSPSETSRQHTTSVEGTADLDTARPPKVHFSPDLQPGPKSGTVSKSRRSKRKSSSPSSALFPGSSIGGDTLEASPPPFLPTTTAPDASSDEESSSPSKINKTQDVSMDFDEEVVPDTKSTSQSITSALSQSSAISSITGSRGRKRPSQASAKGKRAGKAMKPPKQIKVDRNPPETSPLDTKRSRGRKKAAKPSKESDELDFDFDMDTEDENEPRARNRASKSKAAAPKRAKRAARKA